MPSFLSTSTRVPLRERCNIVLRVDTSGKRAYRPSLKKSVTTLSEPGPYLDTESDSFAAKVQGYTGLTSNSIGEIIPGMFVAFHDDRDRGVKVSEGGKQFTHVVSISSSSTPGLAIEYSSTYDDGSHIRALHLTIPRKSSTNPLHPPRLSLSLAQLRVARDFLSLALPYTPHSSPTAWSTSQARLLITTPLGRPVDAVCVIATYLSFTSGEDLCDVLRGINEIEELASAWKRQVCEQDAEFAQLVADEEDY